MLYENLNKNTIQKAFKILQQAWYTEEEIKTILEILYQIAEITLEIHWQKFCDENFKI